MNSNGPETTIRYQEFEASFEKQNRILKWSLILVLIILSTIVLMLLSYNRLYFMRNLPVMRQSAMQEEVCHFGLKSILENQGMPSLVKRKLLQTIKKRRIVFNFNIEKYFTPVMLDEKTCRVVIKERRGLLAFKVYLKKNSKGPFGFKIHDLDEIKVKGAR